MKTAELSGPPPFLQGVYVRETFDFDKCGSALPQASAHPEPNDSSPPISDEPQLSAMMSDDDFLNSLLTPQETRPLDLTPQPIDLPPSDKRDSANNDRDLVPWSLRPEQQKMARRDRFPFNFSWIEELDLEFSSSVTLFVGENGSGKSTLLEAVAGLSGFPVWGGGRNDLSDQFGPEQESELAQAIYPHFRKRPRDGYFFRAEYYAQFASLLDARKRDKEFKEDPYGRYGGQSLHTRSHGESFLALLENRLTDGLFLLDEPESALSPKRQLALLAMMVKRIKQGRSQFIIATHSPILMTYPGATIISFDTPSLEPIDYKKSEHFLITKGILEHPEQYWKHLRNS
jgi:predicted ATPase